MNESKELLEATVKGLREKIDQLNSDLTTKIKELANVNKPTMTSEMFDEITELVEGAIETVSINEDDLEFSMDIGYDRKVELHDICLQDSSKFVDKVMSEIDGHYKMIDTKE